MGRAWIFLVLLLGGCSHLIWHPGYKTVAQTTPITSVDLHVELDIPIGWIGSIVDHHIFYIDQQWYDPTKTTAVGVIYITMLSDIDPHLLLWFVKQEYAHSGDHGGHLIREWNDENNRYWVEAEDDRYHVTAYTVCYSNRIWIIYSGYKNTKIVKEHIAIARQAIETVRPYSKATTRPAASRISNSWMSKDR